MFGGKKRKAFNAAVAAVQTLLRPFDFRGGPPKGFWSDAYVIGYLMGSIALVARLATNDRLATDELGKVINDVFANVAPQHYTTIQDAIGAFEQQGDPDAKLGFTNGEKCVAVGCGLPGYDDDTDVLKARTMATELSPKLGLGPSNPTVEAGGTLIRMLFHDMVRKRLGPTNQGRIALHIYREPK